ncbi:uncharacterized membrane protein (DUF106 family) [Bacillus sp. SLBN-46]|uniref:hypothetical protein n=1 Tax=Bacillus sp. SLBN-46 TaxID=3042283 RepID=UPI00285B8F2D|nr:hypothetical protein [Bacillus sp. SLBN-46]MDR6123582.1 uncharacterized membrane protein (DUF106 family) [Bacillus sp. SLBN-46]
MIVAWLITIGLFLVCIYATTVIINGLEEKDQLDLAELQSQLKNTTKKNDKKDMKLAI